MTEGTERVEATRRLIPPYYAPETCRFIERLQRAQTDGEVEVSYEEFRALVSPDVSETKFRSNLESARRYCFNVYRVWWQPVRGEKRLKRLDDPERLALVVSRTRSGHRRNKRTMGIAGTINRNTLNDSQQGELRAYVASTATMLVMSEQKTIKALTASDGNLGPPNMAKLLEVMKG